MFSECMSKKMFFEPFKINLLKVLLEDNCFRIIKVCFHKEEIFQGVQHISIPDIINQSNLYCKCNQLSICNIFSELQDSIKFIHKLSNSCRFLTCLTLNHNYIGNQGAKLLRKAEFKFIQSLYLQDTGLTQLGALQIAKGKWKFFKDLIINHNTIRNKGFKHLVQHSQWSHFRRLKIADCGITSDGIIFLQRCNWQNLISMELGWVERDSEILETLIRYPFNTVENQIRWQCLEYAGLYAKIPKPLKGCSIYKKHVLTIFLLTNRNSRASNSRIHKVLKNKSEGLYL